MVAECTRIDFHIHCKGTNTDCWDLTNTDSKETSTDSKEKILL